MFKLAINSVINLLQNIYSTLPTKNIRKYLFIYDMIVRMYNYKFMYKSLKRTFQGIRSKAQKFVTGMVDLIFCGNSPKEKI